MNQSNIVVYFKHWKYEFTNDDLQYASANKKGEAKTALRAALQNADLVKEQTITLTENQILCANEAFPEAAIADPLADLRLWNEWRSGVRIFPYPGEYSNLSITNQLPKTNSTSSIGVIGEIIAGIFGQALIAPEILVRVIRKWPDFIFDSINNRYAFLEAKAFTQNINSSENIFGIPNTDFGECLLDAVQHQNFDPHVKVWYAFTGIQQIEPHIIFSTQFIELDVNDSRRNGQQRTIPQIVIDGLAERAIQKGLLYFLELHGRELRNFTRKYQSFERKKAEKLLSNLAIKEADLEINDLLKNQSNDQENNIEKIYKSIKTQIHNLVIPDFSEDDLEGNILRISRNQRGKIDRSIFVRKTGLDSLYKIELDIEERDEIAKT